MAFNKFLQLSSSLRGVAPFRSHQTNNMLKNLRGSQGTFMAVRNMGQRTLSRQNITMSFSFRTFVDRVHYYTMLHSIPIVGIVLLTNLIKGKTKLADIPEGYEPYYWEYYEHPISRFIAKHFMRDPEMLYEIKMQTRFKVSEKRKKRLLDEKIKELNRKHQDFNCWFYMDSQGDLYRQSDKEFKDSNVYMAAKKY